MWLQFSYVCRKKIDTDSSIPKKIPGEIEKEKDILFKLRDILSRQRETTVSPIKFEEVAKRKKKKRGKSSAFCIHKKSHVINN